MPRLRTNVGNLVLVHAAPAAPWPMITDRHHQIPKRGDAADHFAGALFVVIAKHKGDFTEPSAHEIQLHKFFQSAGESQSLQLNKLVAEGLEGLLNEAGAIGAK